MNSLQKVVGPDVFERGIRPLINQTLPGFSTIWSSMLQVDLSVNLPQSLSTLYYVQKEVLLAERCQSFWCRSSSAWLERSTHNRKVAGSNPVSGTHNIHLNWHDHD